MQCIVTTFKGPTNHQGARWVARFGDKRVTIPHDHALSAEGNDWNAFAAICQRLNLDGRNWTRGELNSRSAVYVKDTGFRDPRTDGGVDSVAFRLDALLDAFESAVVDLDQAENNPDETMTVRAAAQHLKSCKEEYEHSRNALEAAAR